MPPLVPHLGCVEALEPVADRAGIALSGGRGTVSRSAEPVAVVGEPYANPPDQRVGFPGHEKCRRLCGAGSSFACAGREGEAVFARPLEDLPLGRCGSAMGWRAATSGILVGRLSAGVTAGPSIVRGPKGGTARWSGRAIQPAGRGGPTEVMADACPELSSSSESGDRHINLRASIGPWLKHPQS
jgi:hypothetical protein